MVKRVSGGYGGGLCRAVGHLRLKKNLFYKCESLMSIHIYLSNKSNPTNKKQAILTTSKISPYKTVQQYQTNNLKTKNTVSK